MNTKPVNASEDYILTEADYEYIESMEIYFNITRDEAYQRFCNGNIDGLTDDALEDNL